MKYSEFLQLSEILEQNNISIEDFKKNPVLYEGIIGNIMKQLGGNLLKLAGKGVKYAISKGVNSNFQEKLNKDLEKIKNDVEEHLGLEGKTPPADSPVQNVLTAKKNKKVSQKEASSKIIKYMDTIIDEKSKLIVKSIDNKAGLTDDDKDSLKIFWNSKIAAVKLNLFAQLGNIGVTDKQSIEDESEILTQNLNKYIGILLTDAKKRAVTRGKEETTEPQQTVKQTTEPQQTVKQTTKPQQTTK